MKKRVLSLMLALSLMSVPALAVENSTENFTRSMWTRTSPLETLHGWALRF